MITIWRASLEAFWIWEPGTVNGNITMLRNMGTMYKGKLGLEGWFTLLGPYTLKDEVGTGVACTTLRLSLIKVIYVGNLPQDSMKKSPTAWSNIYGAGVLGMGDTIFTR